MTSDRSAGQSHRDANAGSPGISALLSARSRALVARQEISGGVPLAGEELFGASDDCKVADSAAICSIPETDRYPWRKRLHPFGKLEWHPRQPGARRPFVIKRMSWSWFSAELVRVWRTELEFRVKGDAAYLALHDSIRSDGETTIDGGSRSTLTDLRDKLTFAPIGSSVGGWNRFEGRTSSVFAVYLPSTGSDHDANDISKVPPSLYFENNNLRATLQKLQSVLDGSGINDRAYAETLGLLLL